MNKFFTIKRAARIISALTLVGSLWVGMSDSRIDWFFAAVFLIAAIILATEVPE